MPGVSDERLKKALGIDWETPLLDFSALDLMRAKDYQQEILEKLDVERNVHGHFRNLVVAATGTGKTVIAAFDFKRYREAHPDCHFLFIAHDYLSFSLVATGVIQNAKIHIFGEKVKKKAGKSFHSACGCLCVR